MRSTAVRLFTGPVLVAALAAGLFVVPSAASAAAAAVVPAVVHVPSVLKVRKSAPVSQAEALDLVLERTFEWIVRDVVGNRSR